MLGALLQLLHRSPNACDNAEEEEVISVVVDSNRSTLNFDRLLVPVVCIAFCCILVPLLRSPPFLPDYIEVY